MNPAWSSASALSGLGRRTEDPPITWLMHMALARPGLVSLAAGFTDNDTLPVREVARLINRMSKTRAGRAALQYGTTQGDPELRDRTARRLAAADRVACDPARLLITSGSQQLLYLALEALCDPGDLVLVEDPTYFVFLGILQSRAIRARGIRLDPDGINLAHLESVLDQLKRRGELPRLKALYLVSYFQNPTGTTTAFEKKAGALKLLRRYERAAGHPIYLIEDAAYRELRFHGGDVRSALAAPGGRDRVLYAGTYSKPFATGARVGFGLLPGPLFQAALRIKGNHDFGTSNLLQRLLAGAIGSGDYDRHLGVLRSRYARKARVMQAALKAHVPAAVGWREPNGGLYIWATLPPGVSAGARSRVFQKSLKRGVLYVPGELCFAPDRARPISRNGLRLSFGGAPEADIRKGIERLGSVLSGAR
ncbi:MAG: PLP-dependent aminotransferase family protein [Verrucomicrobiota bacterium]